MFSKDIKTVFDKKTDSNIKDFFTKINELLAILYLNPLYKLH